jgi:hypothetical protein
MSRAFARALLRSEAVDTPSEPLEERAGTPRLVIDVVPEPIAVDRFAESILDPETYLPQAQAGAFRE